MSPSHWPRHSLNTQKLFSHAPLMSSLSCLLCFCITVLQPYKFSLLLAWQTLSTASSCWQSAWLRQSVYVAQLSSAKSTHQTPSAHLQDPESYTFAQFLLDLKTQLIWLHLILELQGLYVGPQHVKGIFFSVPSYRTFSVIRGIFSLLIGNKAVINVSEMR